MKKTSVLIVEDEVIIARDLAQTLTKLGYVVVGHCVKGEDAIDGKLYNIPTDALLYLKTAFQLYGN